jgi:hypothetical protein
VKDELTISEEDDKRGKERLVGLVELVLKYSVNTWDQGFMVCLFFAFVFGGEKGS